MIGDAAGDAGKSNWGNQTYQLVSPPPAADGSTVNGSIQVYYVQGAAHDVVHVPETSRTAPGT